MNLWKNECKISAAAFDWISSEVYTRLTLRNEVIITLMMVMIRDGIVCRARSSNPRYKKIDSSPRQSWVDRKLVVFKLQSSVINYLLAIFMLVVYSNLNFKLSDGFNALSKFTWMTLEQSRRFRFWRELTIENFSLVEVYFKFSPRRRLISSKLSTNGKHWFAFW